MREAAMAEDIGATVSDWLDLVRRARLSPHVRLVAYYLAGRANNDGTHIYPGIFRTAVECELSSAVARRALKTLRDVGLVEVVKRGNRRLRKSDEYRLIIGANILEHIKVPSPVEHTAAIVALTDREREQQQERQARMAARRRTPTTLTQERALKPPTTLTQNATTLTHGRASTSPVTSPVEATPIKEDLVDLERPLTLRAREAASRSDLNDLRVDGEHPAVARARRHVPYTNPPAGAYQSWVDAKSSTEALRPRPGGEAA